MRCASFTIFFLRPRSLSKSVQYCLNVFDSTIGIPQGDGLSPVLFVCYLEAALQDCRSQLSPRPIGDSSIPQETGYADDISFYSTDKLWLEGSLPYIAAYLREWSLNVNQDKTEWITINAKCDNWKSSKQLGSLMGEHEDIRRRIELASRAYINCLGVH